MTANADSPLQLSRLDLERLPSHVAIIMDGNGRWATSRGTMRTRGHEAGSDAVRTAVRSARRIGVDALTLYAFSAQNWQRPQPEVDALMILLRDYLLSERDELMDNGVRLRAVGRLDQLPPMVRDVLDPLIEETRDLEGMVLTLCLSYGGQEEIVDAARALVARAQRGEVCPEQIDEQTFEGLLPSADVGPVDLLIRTGGDQRISNFLLWNAAYAELHFTPKLWPDFGADDLIDAIACFQGRERRFGGVNEVDAASYAQAALSAGE